MLRATTTTTTTTTPTKSKGEIIEGMLLQTVSDRTALHKNLTTNYQTEGLAVIFILDIIPTTNTNFNNKYHNNELSPSNLPNLQRPSSKTTLPINPIEKINIIKRARSILEQNHIFDSTAFKLVKYDEHRMFILCNDPIIAMKRMLRARQLIHYGLNQQLLTQIQSSSSSSSSKVIVTLSGGCELGNVFELMNDYFGDPVNVASKLAEDTANPGQLLVSFGRRELEYVAQLKSDVDFELGTVIVSGVTIEYYCMNERNHDVVLRSGGGGGGGNSGNSGNGGNSAMGFLSRMVSCCVSKKSTNTQNRHHHQDDDPVITTTTPSPSSSSSQKIGPSPSSTWEDLVVIQSDLSGFTRLTKKYGILHFMTIILHCRRIFNQNLQQTNGELLKYDGDNIMCKFQSSIDAIRYVLQITKDISAYNQDKEKDYQIRFKISMAKGLILLSDGGDIIIGHAWEECCQLSEDIAKVGEILVTERIRNDLMEDPKIRLKCDFETRSETEDVAQHYNVRLKG